MYENTEESDSTDIPIESIQYAIANDWQIDDMLHRMIERDGIDTERTMSDTITDPVVAD